MKFVIDESFARPFAVLRMFAEFAIYLAQAIAIVGAFTYAYQASHNPQVSWFLYGLKNVVFIYIFTWPLTAIVEVGRIYPAGDDGKYDTPTWLFWLMVLAVLAFNTFSLIALNNLPNIIAPLLKS